MPEPEQIAREKIDHMLKAAGWIIQDRDQMKLVVGPGIAVREFPLYTDTEDGSNIKAIRKKHRTG